MKAWLAVCAAALSIILGAAVGSVAIPPRSVAAAVGQGLFGLGLPEGVSAGEAAIVWHQRLPRALLAFLAGAALSVSGAVMQSLLRNPLASSYTLGVSSGASLGAGLVIFMGVSIPFAGGLSLPFFGFSFGLGTIFLVMGFARALDPSMKSHTIILAGMVLGLFVNAVTTLMFSFFRESAQRMLFWQMGSFAMRGWGAVHILAALAAAGIAAAYFFRWELDILSFGEEQAMAVGVDVKKARGALLVSAAALTGATVAFVGVIGFVDLVAPHVVRKLFGPAHRLVVPMSAVVGGTFMVLCDIAARVATPPVELPVGAVTALLGGPFFAYVFFAGRGGQR